MGKTAIIDKATKLKVLEQFEIFNKDGSLKSQGHPIWTKAHSKLKGIQKKSIYLDVSKNRNDLKTKLLRHFIKEGIVQLELNNPKQVELNNVGANVDKAPVAEKEELSFSKDDKHTNEIAKLEEIINLHEAEEARNSDVFYNADSPDSEEYDDPNLSDSEEYNEDSRDFCPKTNKVPNPNPQNFPPINFTLTLDEVDWKVIKPVDYKLPKHLWTPVVFQNIIDNTPLRCAYIFECGKVYRGMCDKYIDFKAYCKQKDCKTYMYGVCKKKPVKDEDGITFEISTYDSTSLYHSAKRPFASARRKEAGRKLIYMSAGHYRNEMVNDMMSFSEQEERPDIPSGANLRTVKAEGLRNYLGISGPKDPVKCLIYMMDEFDFIKNVFVKPFGAWYWFDKQIELWDASASLNPVLKLDATGSLVKKVMLNEEPSSYIYLYQLMTTIDNNYAPLSQMISAKHDHNGINHWLNAWKSKITILPTEIVCDDGLALLYGLCETFNDCTYIYYLSACIQILQGNKEIPPLKCHMGLDRAHITKTPSNWKCVKGTNHQEFKDLVTRSIALAAICETLERVKEILLATFVIFESKTMIEKSICDQKYEWMLDEIENFGLNPKKEDKDDKKEVKDDVKDNDEPIISELNNSEQDITEHMQYNTVKEYIQSIHNEALALVEQDNKIIVTDDNKNLFYCKEIINNLFFLYSQFPAWTNVMRAYFGSSNKVATSADNEAMFKDLKNTYNLKGILAPHTFVMYHSRIVAALVKIAYCALMKILNKNSSTTEQNMSELLSELSSIIEQTKQVASDREKRVARIDVAKVADNKNVHIDKSGTKVERHDVSKVKSNKPTSSEPELPSPNATKFHIHLRNGTLEEAVKIRDRDVQFDHTCAYDSGFAILSSGYERHDMFRNYVDENIEKNGLFFSSIKGYSNRTMNMLQFYTNRGLLHLDLQADKSQLCYDCLSNINTLLSFLLKNELSCCKVVRCNICGHRRVDKYRILVVNDEYAKQLIKAGSNSIIRECIMELFRDETLVCRQCRKSKKTAIGTPSFGFFLIIDISKVFEDHIDKLSPTVADIPTTLNLQGAKYILAGYIIRIIGGIGHYVAYCYDSSKDKYTVKDDMRTESYDCKTLPRNSEICTIIYVITDN